MKKTTTKQQPKDGSDIQELPPRTQVEVHPYALMYPAVKGEQLEGMKRTIKAKGLESEGQGLEKSPKAASLSPKPAGQVLAMFATIGVSEYRARICIKLFDHAMESLTAFAFLDDIGNASAERWFESAKRKITKRANPEELYYV